MSTSNKDPLNLRADPNTPSRDKGLPYSAWLATVDTRFDVPANAILLTLIFACLMSLINLGSRVAFEAMLSLATVALMATYLISIGCVLLKRLRGEQLPSARWYLGRYGLVVNTVAVIYTAWSVSKSSDMLRTSSFWTEEQPLTTTMQFFWAFWPSTYHVRSETFNWAGPLFLVFLGCALLTYHFHARDSYDGPVAYVTQRQEE